MKNLGKVIVRTKDLSKKYGENLVLSSVNIELMEGKIYGFIGENGAGKTTFMRILTGLSDRKSTRLNSSH